MENYEATDDQSPRKAKIFDLHDLDENDYEINDEEVDQDLKLLDAFDQDEYDQEEIPEQHQSKIKLNSYIQEFFIERHTPQNPNFQSGDKV